jgi:hypothetical protein
MSDKKRQVRYMSKLYKGSQHDFTLMKMEFPLERNWFSNLKLRVDSGFQGIEKTYESAAVHISLRRKRAKKGMVSELSAEQIAHNKEVGKERIYVEHAIGGMKRYRILYNKIRLKCELLMDKIVSIAAGLWNFTLAKV